MPEVKPRLPQTGDTLQQHGKQWIVLTGVGNDFYMAVEKGVTPPALIYLIHFPVKTMRALAKSKHKPKKKTNG